MKERAKVMLAGPVMGEPVIAKILEFLDHGYIVELEVTDSEPKGFDADLIVFDELEPVPFLFELRNKLERGPKNLNRRQRRALGKK